MKSDYKLREKNRKERVKSDDKVRRLREGHEAREREKGMIQKEEERENKE